MTATKSKPTFTHKALGPLPRLLKEMTPEQRQRVLDFYKGLALKELRIRQDLTTQQLRFAVKQRNVDAIDNLTITHDLLTQAVAEVHAPPLPDPCEGAEYPGLVALAKELADDVCRKINERAPLVEADTPYKTQGTLEYLIQILQARV